VTEAGVKTAPGPRSTTLPRRLLAAALAVAVLVALGLDRVGGRGGAPELDAVPDLLRAGGATVLLFAACGYAPARLLCPAGLRRHLPLLVLPVGAATSALSLTVLGFLRVPLWASLAVVIALGAAGAVAVARRGAGPAGAAGSNRRLELLAPAAIAVAVAVLLASPMVRNDSFATVLGQNGDAHMTTGAAELLQQAPPGAERPELPIDHMPRVWQSKYPIYYVLAGVSTLSGLDPVQTFGTLLAVVLALAVLGFYLLAAVVLQAAPLPALLAMLLVGIDRLVYRLGFEPFFNQSWALFSFPFVLVLGWWYVREPSRGSFGLLALFGAVSVFAYPLLAPFLVLFVGVAGWLAYRRARGEGRRPGWVAGLKLPRGRRSLLFWVPVVVLVGPLALLLLGAAVEKMLGAASALLPGGDLAPWSGATPGFQPISYFVGVPETLGLLLALVAVLAAIGIRRAPGDARIALGAVLAGLLLGALWVDLRDDGALFHFRALSFFGPTLVALAGVAIGGLIGERRRELRAAGVAAGVVLCAFMLSKVRIELDHTFPHVSRDVWELRGWNDRIPAGASVRVDVTPIGVQQWAGYMLSEHPLSASRPLRLFFPHPPVGRKADYLLVNRGPRRPADAAGRPVLRNGQFDLYRMRANVPGRDVSSRKLVDPQLARGDVTGD
jgi:hypothetical protein